MKTNERIYELKVLGNVYAKAKADEVYLTHFRKSKLAILKKQYLVLNPKWSNAKCDDEARADKDYIEVLEAIRTATEASTAAFWELKTSHAGINIYQTKQADRRAELNNLKDMT